MNFIFVSLQRINTDRESTSTSLAKELARQGHNVLYVNPPVDRKTLLKKDKDIFIRQHIDAIRSGRKNLVQAGDRLWVLNPVKIIESINWIPFTPVFRFFNRLNNMRLGSEIKAALKTLQFDSFVLINDKDIFRSFYLKEILKPDLYIYLDRDFTLGFKYWQRHGTVLEPELMKKSDAILCNSLDFTKNASKYNKRSFYIGNGVDLSVFNSSNVKDVPPELAGLPRPLIGYVGVLTDQRLDLELINKIAERQNGTLVLVGPEDDSFKNSELHKMQHVRFIEKKHTNLIPAYISAFDVCINPQIVNEITIGNFPLKIVEYLAMGKPVVATATNTMKEVFADHCYLSENHDDYLNRIEQALLENNPEAEKQRISFASAFSWKNIAGNVAKVISELKEQKTAV